MQAFKRGLAAATIAVGLGLAAPANAVPLLGGFGGPADYGQSAMLPNDDDSSNLLNLPFDVNFFGTTYSSFFINNNGNVTFNSPIGGYTPIAFPIASQPMIAPYWGDVDTRCGTCGAVYVAEGQTNNPNDTVVVTWNNVGYYSNSSNLTNNFQLVLRNRSDTGVGNFDIDFRYDRLQWTTGSASGGSGGLGGTPAQAGFDAGDGVNYQMLPGSRTAAVLDLATTSNVSTTTPGLWSFAIRNGALPGSSADNPIMPTVVEGNDGFTFDFGVVLNQRIFVDPPVAVGYVYALTDTASPDFASVLLPNVGDGQFTLTYGSTTVTLAAGDEHFFGTGVRSFTVEGIETSAGLDPADQFAFVTGLTFAGQGRVQMTQTPIVVNVPDGNTVPEPGSLALVALAMAGMGWRRFQQRRWIH